MATKSITQSVNMKRKGAAEALARAIEKAYVQIGQTVKISRPVSEASEREIKKMFGESK